MNLIIKVSGQDLKERQAKVETAKTLWISAVNNEAAFGRWAFLQINNPAKAMQAISEFLG